jgi:hypothetical protein
LIKTFHQQLALAVVIGNEGLLRNRYSLQDIQAAAEKLHLLLPKDTTAIQSISIHHIETTAYDEIKIYSSGCFC